MTRGRRKDLTIPPSRALLQQRDYRARKAQYVADLEDRVRRTEDENVRLRKEVDSLRLRLAAGGTLGPSAEVVAASSELMHQLTTAAASLAKFQQIAFNEQAQAQAQAQAHALAQAQLQTQNLQPPLPPPPPPELPPIRPPPPPVHAHAHAHAHAHDHRPPANSFPALPPPSQLSRQSSPPRQTLHPSRHQAQTDYHHHSLSQPTSLSGPATAPRDYAHLHASHSEPPRAPTVSPPASTSTSSSASMRPTVSHRSHAYTGYNEAESAWGYFDSRDLDEEDDEEDELYEDDHTSGGSRHRRQEHGSPLGLHSNGMEQHHASVSPYLSHRMSTLRSTSSTPPSEDSPMRMREDSPMRTR